MVTNSIAYFSDFAVQQGSVTIPQTLALYGSTSRGVMTTNKSKAELIVSKNGNAELFFDIAWTAFNGVGSLRADGVQLARTSDSYAISNIGVNNNFAGEVSASLDGNLSVVYFYLKNSAGALGAAPCNPTGEIRGGIKYKYK